MTLTGLVLAGGLSSRMGRDKATLLIDGQPLWARQLALLRQLTPECITLSARTVPDWAPSGIEIVVDTPPSRGPLSGVTAGLTSLTTSHLLVLAVDLPLLTVEHLKKLLQRAGPGRGIIPRNGEQFEPLAAIYPKEASAVAQKALASPDVSLQSFVRMLVQRELLSEYLVPEHERVLYRNLNTPVDLLRGAEANEA